MICTCGHREYDHLTEEGDCWKCSCTAFVDRDALKERVKKRVEADAPILKRLAGS